MVIFKKYWGERTEIFGPIDGMIDTDENGNVEISTMLENNENGIVYAYVKTDITGITLS